MWSLSAHTTVARTVLQAAAEADREGRPKRDQLTEEESAAVIKLGLEVKAKLKMRDLALDYFIRITDLMDEGLTQEQAREKIYQDLLDKGDVEGAKAVRRYQDYIHPLKSNDQSNKPPLSQPPSAA